MGGSHGDIAQALSLAVWQHRGSRSDRTAGAGMEFLSESGQWVSVSRLERSGRRHGAGYEEPDAGLSFGMEL